MPTYQYTCTTCDHELEAVQSFSDDPLTDCPECSGRLRKVFSAVGVVFKGSGFYRTDSRADSRAANGSKNGGSGTGDTKGGSSKNGNGASTSNGSSSSKGTSEKSSGGSSGSAAATKTNSAA